MIGIYCIRNKETNEIYVGQSVCIERRWMEHKTPKNMLLQSRIATAIRNYGLGAFEFSVLCECDKTELDRLEQFYIAKLKPAYNITIGGHTNIGYKASKQTREKLRIAGKNQWKCMTNDERNKRIANNLKGPAVGHCVSEQTREKLRIANVGKKQSRKSVAKRSEKLRKSMAGKQNRKASIIVLDMQTGSITIYPMIIDAAKAIGGTAHQISRVFCRENHIYKNRYMLFKNRSVETMGDECNPVGEGMSCSPKCTTPNRGEEIVHSDKMGNCRGNDKGITQLAIRSGQFKNINVTDVREGELKGRNRLTGEVEVEWIADDKERSKAKVVGYMGYFKLLSGYEKTTYWSIEELEQHGVKYSQTYRKGYGVWKDNFDSMAKKTVVKLMLNKGDAPMSVEMQQAVKYDQSVILDEDGNCRYIDNSKPTAEEKLEAIAAKEQQIEDAQVVNETTAEQPATDNEQQPADKLF